MGLLSRSIFFGFTNNSFTMLGLSLVIGIIVDDAIYGAGKHHPLCRNREKQVFASLVGAREITSAAMRLPSRFWPSSCPSSSCEGNCGKFFFQFASPSRRGHDFALGSADHRAHRTSHFWKCTTADGSRATPTPS